jgi:phospholipid/cholesterol/gamma-HCH transport system substrate-binding protein
MTEQQEYRLKIRVGGFVLAAIALFATFVLAVGGGARMLEDRYTLRAAFRSAEGLLVGASVRLAGLNVGRVTNIGFGRDPGDKRVMVELSLDRRYQERIREDSVATISTIGVVGDKYVEVAVGTPDRKVLEPGAFLAAIDPPDYTALLQQGTGIVTSVNKLAAAITEGQGLLHSLAYDPKGKMLVADLSQAVADLKLATGKLARGEGTLGALINDPTLYQDVSSLFRGTKRGWLARMLFGSGDERGESDKSAK